jgi:hypothetical protein
MKILFILSSSSILGQRRHTGTTAPCLRCTWSFALCDDRIVFARTQPATLRRVATSAASATSTFVEQEFKGLRSTFVEHEFKGFENLSSGLKTCLADGLVVAALLE